MQDARSNSLTTTISKASSQHSVLLILITMAQFMVVVDFTIVQVALPSIGKEFGITVNGLQWIVTSYGLTLAGFLMLSGRVGDLYGHKKLFIIGLLLFSLASLTGGGASSEIVLILARVGQGLGAAMASATGLSILVAAFSEGNERNRALSIFSAATGSGFAAGMILGGIMTSTLGWRWVFDINVPIGVFVSFLSIKYISDSTLRSYKNGGRDLDIFGAISVTAGLMLFVYSLDSAETIGIRSVQTLELILISVDSPICLYCGRVSLKSPSDAASNSTGRLSHWSKYSYLASGGGVCGNDIYSHELSSGGSRLFRTFNRNCIRPNGNCISGCFGFFVCAICKSFRCQTNLNFGDDFADSGLSNSFSVPSRRLFWRIAFTNGHIRIRNWVRLHGNQYSSTYGNEERGRRTCFGID